MQIPEGIKWGTFEMRHEKRWFQPESGAVSVFLSKEYDTNQEAFEAEMRVKRITNSHEVGLGLYSDSIIPVLAASELAA